MLWWVQISVTDVNLQNHIHACVGSLSLPLARWNLRLQSFPVQFASAAPLYRQQGHLSKPRGLSVIAHTYYWLCGAGESMTQQLNIKKSSDKEIPSIFKLNFKSGHWTDKVKKKKSFKGYSSGVRTGDFISEAGGGPTSFPLSTEGSDSGKKWWPNPQSIVSAPSHQGWGYSHAALLRLSGQVRHNYELRGQIIRVRYFIWPPLDRRIKFIGILSTPSLHGNTKVVAAQRVHLHSWEWD